MRQHGTRDTGRGTRGTGRGTREAGQGRREAGLGERDTGLGERDTGRGAERKYENVRVLICDNVIHAGGGRYSRVSSPESRVSMTPHEMG